LLIFVFYLNTLEKLIKLQVVSLSPSAAGASSYILFLQADNSSHLGFPMVIGLTEAQAISMFMEDIKPARPLTHDLFSNFIQQTDVTISYIEISSFQDGVFFAKIHAQSPVGNFVLDARPSDSIALGLRLNVEIRIEESLLNEIAIPMDTFHAEATDDLEIIPATFSEIKAELESSLAKALADENYEEAAQLRDQLNQLTK
jgi:bifunctional DNase/RNase